MSSTPHPYAGLTGNPVIDNYTGTLPEDLVSAIRKYGWENSKEMIKTLLFTIAVNTTPAASAES